MFLFEEKLEGLDVETLKLNQTAEREFLGYSIFYANEAAPEPRESAPTKDPELPSWLRAIDFFYLAAYTVALCVLAVSPQGVGGTDDDSADSPVGYWAGLMPIWILIGSDIIENILSFGLPHHPTTACHEGLWLCLLLAIFTSSKYLSLVAIAIIFAAWGLYCLNGTTKRPVHARQEDLSKN